MSIRVVDARGEHGRYVSLCTHADEENPDNLHAAYMRLQWLRQAKYVGTKVAVGEDGAPRGFIHMTPIESPLSGMRGKDLLVIPCLTINYQLVYAQKRGTGVGRKLVQACEEAARRRGLKGLAVSAYGGEFWFMPSAFFQRLGFERVKESNIWVKKWGDAEDPAGVEAHYEYRVVPGKVVIDYFWSPFCFTVCKEVINVRQVAAEFGDKIELREYRADDPKIAAQYGMSRALFINGQRRDWGHEAFREDLRKELRKALGRVHRVNFHVII
jgi:GNAT superfamily N-acetyltransferase